MDYTKGEWTAKKNALGTWTISTDNEFIGAIDRHFNALLIAAAPELYETLIIAKKWAQEPQMTRNEIVAILNIALAKAEGKEG